MRLARTAAPLAALALAALAAPRGARACSVCTCGDPLVAAAEGQGEDDTVRLALDGEYLFQKAGIEGEPGSTDVLDQYTLRLTGVYSPTEALNVVASAPFVRKKMTTEHPVGPTTATSDRTGLGDVELGARWFVLDRVDFGARRRIGLALSAGTSLPTGENDAWASGARIDEHGQLGTGGWGPYAGASLRIRQDPSWSALVSVSGRVRTENGAGYRYGSALLFTAQAQWSPVERVALGLALEGRDAGRDRDGGAWVGNTGGLVLAATPSVYLDLFRGVWLSARAQLPFFSRLSGEQEIGPTFVAGVSYRVR